VAGLSTAFTELVGCRVPLQQAGMGGVTTPALAGAVGRAGGLGMLGGAGLSAEQLVDQATAAIDPGGAEACVGVNFLVPFLDLAVLEAVAPVVRVVELFYGDPDADVVDRIHQGGALAAWQVGSVDEAVAAVDAGCDLVVVQGHEAGGHVRGHQPLLPLLAEVRSTVDVPLVAAGGIGDGEAVATALQAGADAVRVGTRFLAAEEADVHPDYLSALVAAGAEDTELTETFAFAWPDAPHRVLRSCIEASDDEPAVRSPQPPGRDFVGDVAAAALYAGTSVDHVHRSMSAADIVDELVRGAST
jgi:NAD(P)H-dependent flavin oxidoreductase YrpB (nitropropane dioxygenase family)